jgi:hypothetical protein
MMKTKVPIIFHNKHRLLHRLPGYPILFATYAFVPQRQLNVERHLHHWWSAQYGYILLLTLSVPLTSI